MNIFERVLKEKIRVVDITVFWKFWKLKDTQPLQYWLQGK